jgi:hypothetical protein
MPPEPPFRSLTPPGYADREPSWAPTARYLFFIRSIAKTPVRMDLPGEEQAIWRLDRKTGDLRKVPGTEGSLGLKVGRRGQALWPRGDGKSAALWTARNGEAIPVVNRIDMGSVYYGQFDWAGVFDWWSK